ncbi:hypothetical protein CPC08DRAFT_709944, partial [Agrocybe pediades]
MYSDPNLDAPPPRSQFRRPWSPEPFEPYPSASDTFGRLQNDYYNGHDAGYTQELVAGPSSRRQQRREASEVSVEALDLADYARTLRARQAEDPYPPFPSQVRRDEYPPSSFLPVPVASQASRDSASRLTPPSLVSRGPTLSSHASSSTPSRGRRSRRTFSVPVTPLPSAHASSSRVHFDPTSSNRGPYIVEPGISSQELDISHFPKWSRNWYNANTSQDRFNRGDLDEHDVYTPIPSSHLNGNPKSMFDPGYIPGPYDKYNSYDPASPPLSSLVHGSRDVLPWSNDPPEYGQPQLDPLQKEERMRMLEREFGPKAMKGKAKDDGKLLVDENGNPLIGTLDDRGRLVTAGPKRRVAFRVLQILLSIGASIPILYAAIAIKAVDPKKPPPPANKPPIFVLYVLSVLTLLLLLYMFVVRPCCCVRSKQRSTSPKSPFGPAGMMVLPVGNNTGKKAKKPKGGKKGRGKYGAPPGQDVQVNLIVDPTAFLPQEPESESDSEDESLSETLMPGSFEHLKQQQAKEKKKKARNRNRRRRGVLEGLAMEEEWKVARAWLKKLTMLDVAGVVLWGATFVFILTGKRCPSGGFNGWCNAYNVSSASACLLCVAFGVNVFFDVQDLHASKQSPRTRI